ncbi:AAA family ATPase [Mesorhizobium sp. M0955]|uniref:AAA family ATPase n=2 Tax=unclassified Mesorhizobium TaxID=325217 RepID=UPI00333B22B6
MAEAENTAVVAENDEPIICQIDGAKCHAIHLYLKKNHPDWTVERYKKEYPEAPLLSEKAKKRVAENRAQQAAMAEASGAKKRASRQAFFHEVFELGNAKAAMSSIGKPISIEVFDEYPEAIKEFMPEIDRKYVFNIDLTRKVLIAMQLNKPMMAFGLHGTGKTTVFEQVAARTGRPFIRVQHTAHTEESHVLGQYVVRTKMAKHDVISGDGTRHEVEKPMSVTEFQLGPLPLAMIEGAVYCADEYDFAMPQVVALYQPVLEGKALVIKDAPPEYRLIKPHPEFRIVATGNTNGTGDETGLYQGTLIQNAANYSRFKITEEVTYMEPKIEETVISGQAGIERADAAKLVKIAKEVREQFRDGKISMTVSPRELISAAENGLILGGNWLEGLKLAFTNRCPRVDKKVIEEFAQRILG